MLEEKIETLTKEVVKLRQVLEANGTGSAAPATKAKAKAKPSDDEDDDDAEDETPAKKAPAKKAPAKRKEPEPEHDADEVGTIMRKAAKEDKPAVKKFIAKQKCADLAELLTKPSLFDAAYAFAEGVLDADDDDDADEDEDDV